ncbi:MAG TPA: RHS repeat domain-containing protein, partial [Polyangiaceae bacterium]|nr:RHS repeat domain-containing protein [Polyangiaceae bacterium]
MARTAPVPNIPAIPGMNPGVFIMGGGGAGGGGSGKGGKGSGQGQGAGGNGGGEDAEGGGAGAGSCGTGANASGCPNQHPGSSGGQISRGDPVDVVTGRVFTIPQIDLELPGPLPFSIERRYSSSARDRDVGLGFGWTWSLAWQLYEGRRAIRVRSYDGIEHDFGKLDDGSATLGLHGWLLHREGNGYRLDFPDGRRLLFQEQSPEPRIWLLTAIEDRLRNRITLRYERGLLVGVLDAVGRDVRIRRNAEGRVASLSLVADGGRVLECVRYAYESGNLTDVADADGHTTRFTYLADHLLASQSDANGLTFYFVYDGSDRCTETWGAYPDGEDISLSPDVPKCLVDGTPAKG